jgi:hypothetical protein
VTGLPERRKSTIAVAQLLHFGPVRVVQAARHEHHARDVRIGLGAAQRGDERPQAVGAAIDELVEHVVRPQLGQLAVGPQHERCRRRSRARRG